MLPYLKKYINPKPEISNNFTKTTGQKYGLSHPKRDKFHLIKLPRRPDFKSCPDIPVNRDSVETQKNASHYVTSQRRH